jgi:putative hydrolase of the HAD superfamily
MIKGKKYTNLFFDLDRTLWDFDANSHAELAELFAKYNLQKSGINNFETFYQTYKEINAQLWDDYRNGKVTKQNLSLNRFLFAIRFFGIDDVNLAATLSEEYVKGVSDRTKLFPYALEILKYLSKIYRLHVLTNGFAEVQYQKLKNSGLDKFFTHIITSEEAGAHKPSPVIFKYALQKSVADASECLMIGDDPEVDLDGAKALGIDQMFVNFDQVKVTEKYTYTVYSLKEIKNIL